MNRLRKKTHDWSPIGHFIEEARLSLNLLRCASISHIGRNGNRAAHTVAKMAVQFDTERVWIEDYPVCLNRIILFNCNPFLD
ncbi:hypothetical protein REPUB_Repub10bG0084300 [Reevesia pubescens]